MASATENLTSVHSAFYATETDFVEDWHVRVTWIAFMTLWVIWGLLWVVRSYFVGQDISNVTEPEATSASENGFAKKLHIPSPNFAGYQVVKDSLFSLLCLLSMNSFARASTRAVMILAWFFVAFAVFWFIAELVVDNRYMRVLYSTIFYALGLAIGGLAYKQGFF
ncbi:hypothetical protein PS6_007374 [Mucor atramentarius]